MHTSFDLTRRGALRALAGGAALAAPTTALAVAEADPVGALGYRQSTWDAYRKGTSATDRLQHHLLCAAMEIDEMTRQHPGSRWALAGGGFEPWKPWLRVARFDPYREPHPHVPGGLKLEKMAVIYEFETL